MAPRKGDMGPCAMGHIIGDMPSSSEMEAQRRRAAGCGFMPGDLPGCIAGEVIAGCIATGGRPGTCDAIRHGDADGDGP